MTSQRYSLEFTPKALRALRKLDRLVITRIREAAEPLRHDPRPAGAKVLTGGMDYVREDGSSCKQSTSR